MLDESGDIHGGGDRVVNLSDSLVQGRFDIQKTEACLIKTYIGTESMEVGDVGNESFGTVVGEVDTSGDLIIIKTDVGTESMEVGDVGTPVVGDVNVGTVINLQRKGRAARRERRRDTATRRRRSRERGANRRRVSCFLQGWSLLPLA